MPAHPKPIAMPVPLAFDEAMRRALMVKPEAKQVAKPAKRAKKR